MKWFRSCSGIVTVLLMTASLGFQTGCRIPNPFVDREAELIAENPYVQALQKDPDNLPDFHADELYRLNLVAEDILMLEKTNNFEAIYHTKTAPSFRKHFPKEIFMKMGECIQTRYGDVQTQDAKGIIFKRTQLFKAFPQLKVGSDTHDQQVVDVLTRLIHREYGELYERLVLVPKKMSYELVGIYWAGDDPKFKTCMQKALLPKSKQDKEGEEEESEKSDRSAENGTDEPGDDSDSTDLRASANDH